MDDLRDIPRQRYHAPPPGASPKRRVNAARALRVDAAGSSRLEAGSRLGREAVAVVQRRGPTVWFDYTDLVHHFANNYVPTDVQRMQIGTFRASLAREAEAAALQIGSCSFDPQRRCWVDVKETLMIPACRAAGRAARGDDKQAWRTLARALRASMERNPVAPLLPGDVLLNSGRAWAIPNYSRFLDQMARECHVVVACMTHGSLSQEALDTCWSDTVGVFQQDLATFMTIIEQGLLNDRRLQRLVAEQVKCSD